MPPCVSACERAAPAQRRRLPTCQHTSERAAAEAPNFLSDRTNLRCQGPCGCTSLRTLMARKSLRPELNRIRAWVRQGRTDAWIAHQLEVTVQQIQTFKREQGLEPSDEVDGAAAVVDFDDEVDLRAEDDALIAAELDAAEAERAEEEAEEADEETADEESDEEKPARRRRGRRGGRSARGRRHAPETLEATFDHGEEGYGLWLDPAVQDDPIYAEYWAGHRPVEVAIEEDQIVIRRAGERLGRRRRRDGDRGRQRPPALVRSAARRRSRWPRGRSGRMPLPRRLSGPRPPGCWAPRVPRCQSTSRLPARRRGVPAPRRRERPAEAAAELVDDRVDDPLERRPLAGPASGQPAVWPSCQRPIRSSKRSGLNGLLARGHRRGVAGAARSVAGVAR